MKDQLRNRISNLSLEELKLAYFKLSNSFDIAKSDQQNEGSKRLVAYVNPKPDFDIEDFQIRLKERLPDYMVPSKINQIDEIPRLPNGKVDFAQLQKYAGNEDSNTPDIQKPKNEIEKQLVLIWEEVLNFGPISTDDNFFEIGGDSILSIQIVSKARKNGISLAPNQIFDHQTISELALFATLELKETSNQKVYGELKLTPIQHWFFETHKAAPHYWNQIVKVKSSKQISFEHLQHIVKEIIEHHDALRLSFTPQHNSWTPNITKSNKTECCFYFDMDNMKQVEGQNDEIRKIIVSHQEKCDLTKDSLFRALFFECGDLQTNKIYIIAHHLVIDMVSWSIIKNDFSSGLEQIGNGKKIELGRKTDSLKSLAAKLHEVSNSEGLKNEIPYWTEQAKWQPLPKDFNVDSSIMEERNFITLVKELSENKTKVLLSESNLAFNTKIEDLLLVALGKTVCEWSKSKQLQLGLERHGRTSELISMDVSNTVGWFTSYFPVKLDVDLNTDMANLIKTIKEQLRQVPNEGVGYGVLKYLSKTWAENDEVFKEPELLFNYLGKVEPNSQTRGIGFEGIKTAVRHPNSEYASGLELNSMIENGKLIINWSYCTELYKRSTINKLADSFNENLNTILSVCSENETIGYTPSDFPDADISQDDLDSLLDIL